MRRPLVLVLLLLGAPSPSVAQGEPAVAAIEQVPIPDIAIRGGAAANRSIEVRCQTPAPGTASCTITLELDVVATESTGASFLVPHVRESSVTVDPSAPREPEGGTERIFAPPSQPVHVRIVAERSFWTSRPDGDTPYMLIADALYARHMLLATQSPRLGGEPPLEPGRYSSPLFAERAPVQRPLEVRATLPDGVRLSIDGVEIRGASSVESARALELVVDPGPQDEALLRHGGPFLAAGALSTANADRFAMRAGYELGLHDWIIGSIAIETDFETRFTSSLLVEVATPPAFILILGFPSISAGVGVTWDISERGHRAGVRLGAGAAVPVAGFQATFDYYASDDEWVIGLMGRVSL